MAATIHVLHPVQSRLAAYLRVGHTGHRKLEALSAEGRLGYHRLVFDAAHMPRQAELAKQLKARGAELVLDPNFAELATEGGWGSSVGKLPWSNPNRPWTVSDLSSRRNLDVAKAIAEFAVAYDVDAVLAPSHLIDKPSSEWQEIDHQLCQSLRRELDRAGGKNITIDYQLITTNAVLKESTIRTELMHGIRDLPVENIWLRNSGFGATATGAGTRSYIEAVRALHEIHRPLVADMAGGMCGLAALAAGAVGGLCHGVGQRETFDANRLKNPSRGSGGGTKTRVYVAELDRYFTEDQLNLLLRARGGRSRFLCNAPNCCGRGAEDMIEHADRHFITQRIRQIEDLSSVPESRRMDHFLLRHLDPAVRAARQGARLKIEDSDVLKAVEKSKKRLIRLRDSVAALQESDADISRSQAPAFRGGKTSWNVQES